WVALALMVAVLAAIVLLLRSRYGLALTAIRDNELAARSSGVDVTRTKLVVYILTALGTAMIGALIFLQKLRISPDTAFSVNDWTAFVIFITVIGGIGRVEGPIIGTVVFFVLRQTLADLGSLYLLMLGAVAIAVMLLAPKGIWGFLAGRSAGSCCRWSGACALRRMPAQLEPERGSADRSGETNGCEIRQGHHHPRRHQRDPPPDHVGRLTGHAGPDCRAGHRRRRGRRRDPASACARSQGRPPDRRSRDVHAVPSAHQAIDRRRDQHHHRRIADHGGRGAARGSHEAVAGNVLAQHGLDEFRALPDGRPLQELEARVG